LTSDDADNTDDQRKLKSWSCTIRDDPHCNRANSSRRAKLCRLGKEIIIFVYPRHPRRI
jgi:hypothetical protein